MTAPPSPESVRLTNGVVELRVPAAFGPRVSHYGFAGGPNVFGDAPDAQRETPHGTWRAYGGHRLWAAPESFPATYTIDDLPPEIESSERRILVRRARDPRTGLVASMDVELDAAGTAVTVIHAVENRSDNPQRLAPWGLTVVRPGGVALIPNPERRSQREALLPARTMSLWSYTDLSDPRFAFGPEFLRLRCDPARTAPNKIGVACERGWFAYVAERTAFVVRTAYDPAADYPDCGCSVEIYTEGAFCEVETLAPLTTLAPGEIARHTERWSLLGEVGADDDDASLARILGKHVAE
ncbi:MAG: hypothetical protein JWM87_548 [Candidatus Eremiobacteraeota bacterium]|nr:hypothetical protein [Candidatus Eremiobacteraeota bacterium]